MTNLTTAAGFATFIITSSDILKEFYFVVEHCGIISFVLDQFQFITVINLYQKQNT
jgi:predicted RND superfamily exporter protein